MEIKKPYMYLAAISVMLLLTAAIATPLSAYADKGDDKSKSKDNDDKHNKHHKDRKDKDHDKDKCKPKKNGKYHRDCD